MAAPVSARAITVGDVDDFQSGTFDWQEGPVSPNPPFQNLDGGPGGVGDHSLRNVSAGGRGPGSKMVMFNNAQWTGDYVSAGVTAISGVMRVDPTSVESLIMRIAVQGAPGEQYASLDAVIVPNDGLWYPVTFGLTAADLAHVAGTDSLTEVLSDVSELRILHSATPRWPALITKATLDVDNLTALPEPSALSFLILGCLAIVRRRSRRRAGK